jgi:hypothetical protein
VTSFSTCTLSEKANRYTVDLVVPAVIKLIYRSAVYGSTSLPSMVRTTYGSVEDTTTATTPVTIDPEIQTADAASSVDDDPFDANHTYYLKGDGRPYWTTQRIWNLLLPLLVAGLLIGGAAAFLLRDFGTLYPGQGNGGTDTSQSIPSRSSTSSIKDSTNNDGNSGTSQSYSSNSSNKHHHKNDFLPPNDAGATCSVHPDCSMLIGNCCPTVEGKMLECCNL